MYYMPRIFNDDLISNWMNDFDRRFYGKRNPHIGFHPRNLMRTDVRENDGAYIVDIDLPGLSKDQVEITLENGYLNVTAAGNVSREEKDEATGKLIRQERFTGRMSRNFYVGDEITEEDIKAKLCNGVLSLQIPKIEKKAELPEKKTIQIEG